jgi:hypothetical protein
MAEVDRAKLQFIRDCAVQALRVWIDAPEKLKELIPKFERGYDQLTDKGYGHPWRVQIEAGMGRGAAEPEAPKRHGPPADPRAIERRALVGEVMHWQRLSTAKPDDENWRKAWEQAFEKLQDFDKQGETNGN